jgi:hypothetical protein
MSAPAYHLRKNKAADRFALIEAIRRLPKIGGNLDEYTYFGFGGPYLEDMRLIYEFCPELPMVSIERDPETFNRQKFHCPCSNPHLNILNENSRSFIADYEPHDQKCIFWLDYNELKFEFFQDFMALLEKVVQGSMIKITLRVRPFDYWYNARKPKRWKVEPFQREFSDVLPTQTSYPSWDSDAFTLQLRDMLKRAAQQALPANVYPEKFYPVSSFYYSDGTGMFTLTGIKWPRDDPQTINKAFGDWEFSNLSWDCKPISINLPDLSSKERLHLQECLPCDGIKDTLLREVLDKLIERNPENIYLQRFLSSELNRGAILQEKLKYLITDDVETTETALEQYAAFYRYFPYFLRGTP